MTRREPLDSRYSVADTSEDRVKDFTVLVVITPTNAPSRHLITYEPHPVRNSFQPA